MVVGSSRGLVQGRNIAHDRPLNWKAHDFPSNLGHKKRSHDEFHRRHRDQSFELGNPNSSHILGPLKPVEVYQNNYYGAHCEIQSARNADGRDSSQRRFFPKNGSRLKPLQEGGYMATPDSVDEEAELMELVQQFKRRKEQLKRKRRETRMHRAQHSKVTLKEPDGKCTTIELDGNPELAAMLQKLRSKQQARIKDKPKPKHRPPPNPVAYLEDETSETSPTNSPLASKRSSRNGTMRIVTPMPAGKKLPRGQYKIKPLNLPEYYDSIPDYRQDHVYPLVHPPRDPPNFDTSLTPKVGAPIASKHERVAGQLKPHYYERPVEEMGEEQLEAQMAAMTVGTSGHSPRKHAPGKIGMMNRERGRFLQRKQQSLPEKPNNRSKRFLNRYLQMSAQKQMFELQRLDRQHKALESLGRTGKF